MLAPENKGEQKFKRTQSTTKNFFVHLLIEEKKEGREKRIGGTKEIIFNKNAGYSKETSL